MLKVCLFVPFLHEETPKVKIPKMPSTSSTLIPHSALINQVLNQRMKIGQAQKEKIQKKTDELGPEPAFLGSGKKHEGS